MTRAVTICDAACHGIRDTAVYKPERRHTMGDPNRPNDPKNPNPNDPKNPNPNDPKNPQPTR